MEEMERCPKDRAFAAAWAALMYKGLDRGHFIKHTGMTQEVPLLLVLNNEPAALLRNNEFSRKMDVLWLIESRDTRKLPMIGAIRTGCLLSGMSATS